MPSVREEFKNKLAVKPSLPASFIGKLNRNDIENQSERTVFLNSEFHSQNQWESEQKTEKTFEKSQTKTSKTFERFIEKASNEKSTIEKYYEKQQERTYDHLHEKSIRPQKNSVFIKPKINYEEVPNPLRKLKLKERRLSRISSKNSLEDQKELILTIKDLSVPYPLQGERGPLEESNDFLNKNCRNSQNSVQMSNNDDYIEKFLNHKNPLRRNPNEFNEDSDNITRSSLVSMKNCFKNMKNLKFIDVDSESLNSEEVLNTRMRFLGSKETHTVKNVMTNEELREFMEKSQEFIKNKENSYDLNNFINDMMDIYKENGLKSKKNIEINENLTKNINMEVFDFDKENLNMKLKCLSPVYREMKISARNFEQQNQNTDNFVKKRNSVHNFEHRKSGFMPPTNQYQKNRDFSEFGQHFTKNKLEDGNNISGFRKNIY